MNMIVRIDKLSHDMRGITRIDNKITFVDKTLPNEVVNIRLTKQKKDINEGKVISFLEKSNDRVDFICPYYDICKGCNIAHIEYKKSLEYKQDIVKDIIKRYSDIDINPEIVFDNNIYNYRNKITLRVYDNKLALVGDSFVNIDYCYLVNDNINNVIKLINDIDLSCVKEVIIKGISEIMVIIKGIINEEELLNKLSSIVTTIIVNDKKIYGKDYITININNYTYAIYDSSFFQVNTSMISKLYDKVLEYAGKGNRLLDLYCGAGTIGIYLAKNFNYVRGIEQNKDAIVSANKNKEINKISNIDFVCDEVCNIDKINEDVLIVDPPRHGLDKVTREKIMLSDVNRVVYVSCNPITLARDLNILKEKYMLKDITLFDMFPNTSHVECVVKLESSFK